MIQFIIQQGRPQDKSRVISKIRGNLIQLAQHKFASNVCEKALICADVDTRQLLINEIMTPQSPDGQNAILIMVKDQYASESLFCLRVYLSHELFLLQTMFCSAH